jgi:hypothetical protein
VKQCHAGAIFRAIEFILDSGLSGAAMLLATKIQILLARFGIARSLAAAYLTVCAQSIEIGLIVPNISFVRAMN